MGCECGRAAGIQPSSIKKENRTLDQEVLIFLTAISVPSILLRHWLAPLVAETEFLNSLITYGVLFLINWGLLSIKRGISLMFYLMT